MAIEYLEKPKGCLIVLELLSEEGEVTIRNIVKKTPLGQRGAYSSIGHLVKIGLIELADGPVARGTPKRYRLTQKGKEILLPLSAFFDSLNFLFGKRDVDRYLMLPYRSLGIMIKTFREGRVCLSELVDKEGICKTTAHSSLHTLVDVGLLRTRVKKNFRRSRKEYTLTERGQYIGKLVLVADKKLRLLMKNEQP